MYFDVNPLPCPGLCVKNSILEKLLLSDPQRAFQLI